MRAAHHSEPDDPDANGVLWHLMSSYCFVDCFAPCWAGADAKGSGKETVFELKQAPQIISRSDRLGIRWMAVLYARGSHASRLKAPFSFSRPARGARDGD
jgi:hypothetical protein